MKTDAFLIYEWRISAWGKREREGEGGTEKSAVDE